MVKRDTSYHVYVSSFNDISDIDWVLNGRRSHNRTVRYVSALCIVRMIYSEEYIMSLQLNHRPVQVVYVGSDIVKYIMTADTFYGMYDWQRDIIENRKKALQFRDLSLFLVSLVTALVVGYVSTRTIQADEDDI